MLRQREDVARRVEARSLLAPATVESILARVRRRQEAVGYDGDYAGWIRRVTPPDLR